MPPVDKRESKQETITSASETPSSSTATQHSSSLKLSRGPIINTWNTHTHTRIHEPRLERNNKPCKYYTSYKNGGRMQRVFINLWFRCGDRTAHRMRHWPRASETQAMMERSLLLNQRKHDSQIHLAFWTFLLIYCGACSNLDTLLLNLCDDLQIQGNAADGYSGRGSAFELDFACNSILEIFSDLFD